MPIFRFFLFLVVGLGNAFGEKASPVSISIFPPVQLPQSEYSIWGSRLSLIWGEHKSVHGIDLGLIGNFTQENFKGVALAGGFNSNDNILITGFQLAGAGNYATGSADIFGFQLAGAFNYNAGKTKIYGVQLATIYNSNVGQGIHGGIEIAAFTNYGPQLKLYGFQISLLNTVGTINGFQAGLYNSAVTVNGIQIGLVNQTTNLHGLQLGLINVNHKGFLKFFPGINIGF